MRPWKMQMMRYPWGLRLQDWQDISGLHENLFEARSVEVPPIDLEQHIWMDDLKEDLDVSVPGCSVATSADDNIADESSPSESSPSESSDPVAITEKKPSFHLPVDGENKSTVFRPYSIRGVHMQAFHASWVSFFATFLATFAPAALLPVLRDDLGLKDGSIGHAGIASVAGAVFGRVLMGTVCDTVGPRFGHASLMLLTAPSILSMPLITGPTGFIVVRFIVGLSLASFVACQFWSSVMFSVRIIGIANAAAGGFGSSGGGLALLIMPMFHSLFERFFDGNFAWRITLFVPGALCMIVGTLILTCTQDLPNGNYAKLKKKGELSSQGGVGFVVALRNYRTWCLMSIYALSFGCELTMNNILTSYYFDNFGVSFKTAGFLAFPYGFMNALARPAGGILSDQLTKVFGMPGRIWTLWVLHVSGGLLCIALGFLEKSLVATVACAVAMAFLIESSEGALFAIVPFVSKRSLGVVAGVVGAGGNAGAIGMQAAFFTGRFPVHVGIRYTGITVVFGIFFIPLLYFPMWGGMLAKPKEGASEEAYYLSEFTREEIDRGMALNSLKFAVESRTQRAPRKPKRMSTGLEICVSDAIV